MRFVDDNSIANTIFNGEYTVRSVEAVQGKGIKVSFQAYQLTSVGDDGWLDDTMEFYGNIAVVKDGVTHYLWRRVDGVNTHNMNGKSTSTFSDPFTVLTFNMDSDAFQLTISGFGEDDGSGNDSFADANLGVYVSQVETGMTFFDMSSKDNSCGDYIAFKIAAIKEYLY